MAQGPAEEVGGGPGGGGQAGPIQEGGGHGRLGHQRMEPGGARVDRFGVDAEGGLEGRLRLLRPRDRQHPAVGAGLDAQHGGGEGQGAVVAHLDLVLQESAGRAGQLHGGDGPPVELVGGGQADAVDVGPAQPGVGQGGGAGLEDELREAQGLGRRAAGEADAVDRNRGAGAVGGHASSRATRAIRASMSSAWARGSPTWRRYPVELSSPMAAWTAVRRSSSDWSGRSGRSRSAQAST